MKKEESPKKTGISELTGKLVQVRHANEYDMVFIERILKVHDILTDDLDYGQFVVATEDGVPIGCGRLRRMGENREISCVAVVAERKEKGVETLIVEHLLEFAPSNRVYVITDQVKAYKKMGFVETKEKNKDIEEALDKACRTTDRKAVVLVYER